MPSDLVASAWTKTLFKCLSCGNSILYSAKFSSLMCTLNSCATLYSLEIKFISASSFAISADTFSTVPRYSTKLSIVVGAAASLSEAIFNFCTVLSLFTLASLGKCNSSCAKIICGWCRQSSWKLWTFTCTSHTLKVTNIFSIAQIWSWQKAKANWNIDVVHSF